MRSGIEMKRLVGMLGVAVFTCGFLGCGGEELPKADTSTVTKDGRPAGFEDMMKGMDSKMKNAGEKPTNLSKEDTTKK